VNPRNLPVKYSIPQHAPKKQSSRLLPVMMLPIIATTSTKAMMIMSVIIMNFFIIRPCYMGLQILIN
jgi:hypothetical protein